MDKRRMVKGLALSGLAMLLAPPAIAQASLQKMLQCVRTNVPSALRVQSVELDYAAGNGATRTLKGRLYTMREGAEGLGRALLHIDAPDYMAGASYLVREGKAGDEMYVYLPSFKRVRRVVGDAGYDSMLGTNFSYVDFKQIENGFGDAPATLEAPQEIEQRPAYVVSFKPQPGASANGYSGIRIWIDQQACVALKVDFYDGTTVRKEFTAPAAALHQNGNTWYASQAQLRDLRDGSSTQLHLADAGSDGEQPGRLFDPQQFYLDGK
jgi:hypothetical protein